MYLLVGGTGMVGGEACRLLSTLGTPVRALVRATSDPAKVERLARLGATVVTGDLREPASLRLACEGVAGVIVTASSMPFAYEPGGNTPQTTDQDGALRLIAAARDAGARHFVYTSFPPMDASFPLQDAKRAVEGELRGCGLVYTILQPTYFSEVWLGPAVGFDYVNRKAVIYGTGENPISWISYLDVAQFVAASIVNPAARNATLELGGPEAISPLGAVRIFERVAGGKFDLTHVPAGALQDRLAAAADPMEKSFAGLMVGYTSAAAVDMDATIRTYGVRLRTVEAHARAVIG